MSNSHIKCNVAILAGGIGARLRERSRDLPKPMVPILGKPVLEHQIELCKKYGFFNIALLVQHRHEKIRDYFGDGSEFGVTLAYSIEQKPRGTSGALRDAIPILDDQFFVLYGDTFMDVDLRKMWCAHLEFGGAGTVLLHPNDHPLDSDLVDIDSKGLVRAIHAYPHHPCLEVRNLVNAALYVLERSGLQDVTPVEGKADIAKSMFPRMLELGRPIHGYVTPEYIKDMGTPERLDKVEQDIINGLPERLSSRNLRSAVFLDRDGTLIREVNYLTSPDQVQLLPDVAHALRRLNRSGKLSVVITNQPVIARGELTIEGLAKVHARFESQLGAEGAFIDGLYFCPHHPDSGFQGEVVELKGSCFCRKPAPGLIDQACRDLNIEKRDSWMIGDASSDIESGRRAGTRTILLRTGYAGSDGKHAVKADYICNDLPEAVNWIIEGHSKLTRKLANVAIAAASGKRLIVIGGLASAGKKFSAQILKELLYTFGKKGHIISLDGWLKPNNATLEKISISDRYNLSTASSVIAGVVCSKVRKNLTEPIYCRAKGKHKDLKIEHSIGPDDILIVEGIPALLLHELTTLQRTIKVYVHTSTAIRKKRLLNVHDLSSQTSIDDGNILAVQELNKLNEVIDSRNIANFVVDLSDQEKNNDC